MLVEDDSRITEDVGIGLGAGVPVDTELVKIVVLELEEGVEVNSWLVDVEGTNTVDVDSVIDVKLVDCKMTVEETGVMVELVTNVVEAGGTVLERIVINVITVDVGLEIEVVDGDGVSQIVYSQCIVYKSGVMRNAYNSINHND